LRGEVEECSGHGQRVCFRVSTIGLSIVAMQEDNTPTCGIHCANDLFDRRTRRKRIARIVCPKIEGKSEVSGGEIGRNGDAPARWSESLRTTPGSGTHGETVAQIRARSLRGDAIGIQMPKGVRRNLMPIAYEFVHAFTLAFRAGFEQVERRRCAARSQKFHDGRLHARRRPIVIGQHQ
jgi:hypothetical protein